MGRMGHLLKTYSNNRDQRMKAAAFIFLALFFFFALTCKKEPPIVPPPPSGPDTTSHNFTFTQYTFGGTGGSSYFKDVAIINDTDIWAVGTIYAFGDTMFNAAHWDGKKWKLLQIQFYTFCGQGHTGAYPIDAILALSGTEVWFASNSQMAIWKNDVQQNIMCLPASVYKIWAINGNAVYTVGPIGEIDFYNGTTWTIQSSGTTIDLRDVWGTADGSVVWACGYSNDDSKSILLKYDGANWKTVWSRDGTASIPPYGYFVTSMWGDTALFLSAGRAVFHATTQPPETTQVTTLPWFPYRIRASAENNIVVGGDEGMIWHYNGASWREINLHSGQPLYSIAVSKTMCVAVGTETSIGFGAALIYVGNHQ